MREFEGIYPAHITPMTDDGDLNEEAFRKVMEFNIHAGAHGFWVAGGGGECILLDDTENNRIAEISVEQAAGRAKIIMHVGASTTRRAAAMAEYAAKAGVDAICCVPPFFYSQSDEAIVEHYRVVAAAASLPFFAYNLPSSTGVEITPVLMRKIQERVPQLEGVKHTSLDFTSVREFVSMGLTCFIGRGVLMLPALVMGAAGCINGWTQMVPEPWVELWNAYQAGDLERALAAQDRGIEVAKLKRYGGYLNVIKAGLSERLGIDCGAPRAPGRPLTPENRTALRKSLVKMGFVDAR